MTNVANDLWNDFVSLIFPENCVSCGLLLVRGEAHLCSICRYSLPVPDDTARNILLENKFVYEPKITFTHTFLIFKKAGITQKLLHQIKYNGNYELGVLLGAWYGDYLNQVPAFQSFDVILPVPLHVRKLRSRGYNQSMAIAEGISSTTGKPVDGSLLQRAKFTTTQTKKHKVERWQNVETIFVVEDSNRVKERKVIIVDDVLTTGSTLASCAATLLQHGATEIGICALAAAQK